MDQATAIEELRERYARGGLPLEEFRQLMGTLMVTTDPAECQAILDRLPPEPAGALSIPIARREPARRSGGGQRISAWFGSVDRSGDLWELGPETEVSAVFGEVRLDVRMARLVEGENILRANALFGEVTIIVPQGLRVYIESQARFGEVSVPGHKIGGIAVGDNFSLGNTSAGSYLRIEATATFGEVKITAR
ncbi:MAG TPA: LiaF domain-containing protein [Ktedonobacterales bacterium]|nr:LiaF domain-containing protein [Ktedonobacterales bacterium]